MIWPQAALKGRACPCAGMQSQLMSKRPSGIAGLRQNEFPFCLRFFFMSIKSDKWIRRMAKEQLWL